MIVNSFTAQSVVTVCGWELAVYSQIADTFCSAGREYCETSPALSHNPFEYQLAGADYEVGRDFRNVCAYNHQIPQRAQSMEVPTFS